MSEDFPEDAPFCALPAREPENIPANTLGHGFEPEPSFSNEPSGPESMAALRAKGWATRTILFATVLLAILNGTCP